MNKELLPTGMTFEDLARSLGVSLSAVYHWKEPPEYVHAYLRQYLASHPETCEPVRSGGVDGNEPEGVRQGVEVSGGE